MTRMHKGVAAGLLGLWLAAPGVALAYDGGWHGHGSPYDRWVPYRMANLSIQNQFDGKVELYVDQRPMGVVAGDTTQTFQVPAGYSVVRLVRPDTGFVMTETALRLHGGASATVPVLSPTGTLRLSNQGEVPLKVTASHRDVWINPGSVVNLQVETGNVSLVASIKEPRGEWRALEKTVWVEPGIVKSETLRPDPTVVVVTNRDRMALRMTIDGADAGWVGADSSRRVWVHPGPTRVLLTDPSGRVRSNSTVYVGKGQDARVVVDRYYGGDAVVYADDRPGGPVRPGDWRPSGHPSGDGCSFHQ